MIFGVMQSKNLLEQPISDMEGIKQLLPHREPMILVDGMIYFDGTKSISSLTVLDSNIFVEKHQLSEAGLIEHMAQSAALLTGYKNNQNQLPIKEGFIAAIKNLKIEGIPKELDKILTEVQITYEMETMTMVNLVSKIEEQIIATAEMTLVLRENA